MKIFFDRLSDLLMDVNGRRLGRALAGRRAALLTTGTGEELPQGFTEPFRRTASYFRMEWGATCYVRSIKGGKPEPEELAKVDAFATTITSSTPGDVDCCIIQEFRDSR